MNFFTRSILLSYLVLGSAVVACGGDDGEPTQTNTPPPAASSGTIVVDMVNIAFVAPGGGDDVTISLGDTIVWTNSETTAIQHTATSTSVPAGGNSFDTGLLGPGQTSQPFVPNVRGSWTYFCEVHPTIMVAATITIQ